MKLKRYAFGLFRGVIMVVAACMISVNPLHAQIDPGDPDGTTSNPDDPNGDTLGDETGDTQVPFDDGVSLLVLASVGYGIKKWYDLKSKQAQEAI